MSDPLPPEVLKLLGDDATPERAASRMQSAADWSAKVAGARSRTGEYDASTVDAASAYSYALSAAAIRAMEARRAHAEATTCCSEVALTAFPDEMRKLADKRDAAYKAWKAADKAYDALRSWRELSGVAIHRDVKEAGK